MLYRTTSYSLYLEKTATEGLQAFCGCHGPVLEAQCCSSLADEYKEREQVPHALGGCEEQQAMHCEDVQYPVN